MATVNPKRFRVEERGNIAWVTLDRPDRLNAMTPQALMELADVFDSISDKASIRAVALTGEGSAFCSGADVREMFGKALDLTPPERTSWLRPAKDFCRALRRCQKPILAIINGVVSGGGIGWAFSCDMRLCARSAKFEFGAYSALGLNAGAGATYFLSKMVGLGTTSQLLFLGESVDAEYAVKLGLANWVVEDSSLMDAAAKVLERLAAAPAEAVRQNKRVLNQLLAPDVENSLDHELYGQITCMGHTDPRTGHGAFLEKRSPSFADADGEWQLGRSVLDPRSR